MRQTTRIDWDSASTWTVCPIICGKKPSIWSNTLANEERAWHLSSPALASPSKTYVYHLYIYKCPAIRFSQISRIKLYCAVVYIVERRYQTVERSGSFSFGSRPPSNVGPQSASIARIRQRRCRKFLYSLIYLEFHPFYFKFFLFHKVWRFLGKSVRLRTRQPNSRIVWYLHT